MTDLDPAGRGLVVGEGRSADWCQRAVGPVGASLLLLALGGYPSVFWTLAASLVLASLAVLIAGAGVKAAD